ncbi:hypothetical protein JCM6882_004337 [Rhodosporidiobolus microsporus]
MSTTPTDPAAAAAAQAAINAAVSGVLMPVVIGTFLSCTLLGVLLAVVARYWVKFSRDRIQFKLLVAWLCFGGIVDTGNHCAWAYRYAIQSYTRPDILAEWPLSFTVFGFWTGINIFICQLFFIWRGWVVAGRDRYLFAVLQLVIAFGSPHWELMQDFQPMKPIIYAWLSGGLAVDLLITGYLVYNLIVRPKKSGGSAVSSSPLKRLAVLAMKTNAASSVVQLTVLALMVSKPTLHYCIVGFTETKTYVICVIATLNARTDSQANTAYSGTSGEHHLAQLGGRVKGLGAISHAGYGGGNGQTSVHVHRSVRVDEDEETGPFPFPQLNSHPYRRDEAAAPYKLFVLDEGATGPAAGEDKDAASEKKDLEGASF